MVVSNVAHMTCKSDSAPVSRPTGICSEEMRKDRENFSRLSTHRQIDAETSSKD